MSKRERGDIVISGFTGKVIQGLERLERIAKTGVSERLRIIWAGDAERAYVSDDVLIDQSKPLKLLEHQGGDPRN